MNRWKKLSEQRPLIGEAIIITSSPVFGTEYMIWSDYADMRTRAIKNIEGTGYIRPKGWWVEAPRKTDAQPEAVFLEVF